jgi:hypothetical protein
LKKIVTLSKYLDELEIGTMTQLDTSLTYYCENGANNFYTFSVAPSVMNENLKKCVAPLTLRHNKLVCLSFSALLRTLVVNEPAIFLGGITIKFIAIVKTIMQHKGP